VKFPPAAEGVGPGSELGGHPAGDGPQVGRHGGDGALSAQEFLQLGKASLAGGRILQQTVHVPVEAGQLVGAGFPRRHRAAHAESLFPGRRRFLPGCLAGLAGQIHRHRADLFIHLFELGQLPLEEGDLPLEGVDLLLLGGCEPAQVEKFHLLEFDRQVIDGTIAEKTEQGDQQGCGEAEMTRCGEELLDGVFLFMRDDQEGVKMLRHCSSSSFLCTREPGKEASRFPWQVREERRRVMPRDTLHPPNHRVKRDPGHEPPKPPDSGDRRLNTRKRATCQDEIARFRKK